MSKRKSNKTIKQQHGQRRRWLPGLFALLLVLLLAATGVLRQAEPLIYNLTIEAFAPSVTTGDAVVVELPPNWQQDSVVELLRHLQQARSVVFTPLLRQPQNRDAALNIINGRIALLTTDKVEPKGEPYPTLKALQQQLDVRSRLAVQLDGMDNVLLAASYRTDGVTFPEQRSGQLNPPVPTGGMALLKHLPTAISPFLPHAADLGWPDQRLQEAASGVGLLAVEQNGLSYPALVEYQGRVYPGLLLQLLRLHNGAMAKGELNFEPGGGIRIGSKTIATDSAYRLRPYAPLQQRVHDDIEHYAYDRIADKAEAFKGKTVIIGEAAEAYPLAHAANALFQRQMVTVPGWAVWALYGTLLFVVLLLTVLLPRMRFSTVMVTTVLVVLVLLNSEFLLLLLARQWLPLTLPVTVLLVGFPLISFQGYLAQREGALGRELTEANRQLGRMLQVQGELDQALERYRRCHFDEGLLEQLYHLGLDFERKRQFAKAVSVFQLIHESAPTFRDVAERIQRNQKMEHRVVLSKGGPSTPEGTVIMEAEGLQNPTLGHYEIEREIGRGAMGLVYLGKDPRIGRMVAIKTMALSDEFEETQLKEVKERFYREAETAGRLNHPNIVHVYDIGEERDLAYIAMDYLHGKNLGHFIKPKQLLPIKEVLGVALQVAQALDYAHKKNVVHRDIKPANIIYDEQNKAAKVTDFGVACLTDASKTKTGTVLGSPSYMSPEQVAGKKVDGRADIFSLGVTLYQLITGHLPFEAESLGSLMYKIANEAHPKPSKYRKGIPVCVSRIINKCMQKEPEKRYQTGADLAAALERCKK